MRNTSKEPTTKELKRWQRISEIGCLACILDGVPEVPGDIHHLLSGGRRIGHSHSICLCSWHHRAVLPSGRKMNEYAEVHGPSLAAMPRAFAKRYGDEYELYEIQEALLDRYAELRVE